MIAFALSATLIINSPDGPFISIPDGSFGATPSGIPDGSSIPGVTVLDTEHLMQPISFYPKAHHRSGLNADAKLPATASPELTLCMVGDILLHTPIEEAAKQPDGSYNYSALFAHTGDLIENADLAFVNQEVIIGGSELGISGYPAFNAPYEIADELTNIGFDVVLHGTNHALDKGSKGIRNCLNNWKEKHPEIQVLGIHDSPEDQSELCILSVNNIRIAVLNYTYGTNGIELPKDMPYGVDYLSEERVKNDLSRANCLADFVIVCPHWGTEYRLDPDSMQKKWTDIFLKGGADLVLGTHPHVIEPIEWVIDEESGNKMLVYYSLGNYVNWTSGTGKGIANRMVGGMAQVTLQKNTSNGEVSIKEYGVVPLIADLHDGLGGVTVFPLADYTEEQARQNKIIVQDPDFSLAYCRQLCDRVWGDLWNPRERATGTFLGY